MKLETNPFCLLEEEEKNTRTQTTEAIVIARATIEGKNENIRVQFMTSAPGKQDFFSKVLVLEINIQEKSTKISI